MVTVPEAWPEPSDPEHVGEERPDPAAGERGTGSEPPDPRPRPHDEYEPI